MASFNQGTTGTTRRALTFTAPVELEKGTALGSLVIPIWPQHSVGVNIVLPQYLNDLSDVNTSGATIGQKLQFNGTNWINASI